MFILNLLLAAGLSFIFLAVTFGPMERVFPANNNQPVLRAFWRVDLFFFLGQYLLWNVLIAWLLSSFDGWLQGHLPFKWRLYLGQQPLYLQIIEFVIASDLIIYWAHRIQHRVNFLWRFHKIHHSAEHLDWLAAYREHPLDSIFTIGLINLPGFIIGFNFQVIAALVAFRGLWAIFIHSNIKLPLGPLKYIIGSPQTHHWHHSKSRDVGNYANLSPLMDIIFGTYFSPSTPPESLGITEKWPQSYWKQLLLPLLPENSIIAKKIKASNQSF